MPRVLVLTGATGGLGKSLVKRFWNEGYSLGLIARDADALKLLISTLEPRNKQIVKGFHCDISIEADLDITLKNVISSFGQIDVLINNAAIHGPIGPFSENNMTEWSHALFVNLYAPVKICHAILRNMREGGSIINLSGGGATGPRENFSSYGTAKAALVRFSETLASELKSSGIRVNCIAPGVMATKLLEEVVAKGANQAGDREYLIAKNALDGVQTSMEAIEDLAVFLAGSLSVEITGKIISAVWDNWAAWPAHIEKLQNSDLYTLRRISGKDRNCSWGDN